MLTPVVASILDLSRASPEGAAIVGKSHLWPEPDIAEDAEILPRIYCDLADWILPFERKTFQPERQNGQI
jgi:hypothetical protein